MTSIPRSPSSPPPPPPSGGPAWYRSTALAVLLGIALGATGVALVLTLSDDAAPTTAGTTTVATTTATLPATTAVTPTTSTSTTSTSTTSTTSTTATTTTTLPTALDPTLPPSYGSTSLVTGFAPDPYTRSITAGGAVNVAYLGSPCVGWAAPAADFEVAYAGFGTARLRFYFIPDDYHRNTVLIVRDPIGSWKCNDDSWGTTDPTVDFEAATGGTYDIWVGSYTAGEHAPGTLFVTESAAHPVLG